MARKHVRDEPCFRGHDASERNNNGDCKLCLATYRKAYHKAWRQSHIDKGECSTGCGGKLHTKALCEKCAVKAINNTSALKEKRLKAGVCTEGCGKALVTKIYCRAHADEVIEKQRGLEKGSLAKIKMENPNCNSCGRLMGIGRTKNGVCIDHCHKTGKVRGVLCSTCNKALGLLDDNPDFIKGLLEYILRFK